MPLGEIGKRERILGRRRVLVVCLRLRGGGESVAEIGPETEQEREEGFFGDAWAGQGGGG